MTNRRTASRFSSHLWLAAIVPSLLLAACASPLTLSPTQTPTVPGSTASSAASGTGQVPSSTALSPIAVGGTHACALPGDGTVKCWGDNSYGQLGNGFRTDPNAPAGDTVAPAVTVLASPGSTSPLSGVVGIAAGLGHTCALLAEGTVKCWGWNSRIDNPVAITGSGGQLGDGTTTDRLTPVTVIAGSGSTRALSGVRAITAGWFHTCALLVDGTVKCWGTNWQGQIGDGTGKDGLAPVTAPVTVIAASGSTSALSGVTAIAAGDLRTCALLADGTVRCWGWHYVSGLTDLDAGDS